MKITGLLLCLMLSLTAASTATAQKETKSSEVVNTKRDKPALPEYVIEVRRPEGCLVSPISEFKRGFLLYALNRPALVQTDESGRPINSKVFVSAQQQGELWDVKVWLGTGEFYDAGDSQIGDFKLKLNERTNVEEFSRFGLSPIRVGVVKIIRQKLESPSLTNLTQSVSVEAIEAKALPDPFSMTLKNNSRSDLIAVQYNRFREGQMLELKWASQGLTSPLIKAGDSYRLIVGSEDKTCGDDEGYRPNQSDRIDLVSAVFADGSYEGEPGLAALIKGAAFGNRKNLEKVVEAFRNAGDAGAFVPGLKQLQETLNEETEPYMVAVVHSMFPSLGADSTPSLTSFIRSGMHDVKVNLIRDTEHLEDLKRGNNPQFIKVWFERTKAKYESWLAAAETITSH